jgi:hypothetical protein
MQVIYPRPGSGIRAVRAGFGPKVHTVKLVAYLVAHHAGDVDPLTRGVAVHTLL